MKHEVMKLQIVNQKKITLQVQSSSSILQWYGIQNLFGIFGSHIIVLVQKKAKKKRGSKVACNLSSNLEKLCNNLSMQAK
jgi:hypothetical protein